jgi:hypothetical protein
MVILTIKTDAPVTAHVEVLTHCSTVSRHLGHHICKIFHVGQCGQLNSRSRDGYRAITAIAFEETKSVIIYILLKIMTK